MAKDETGARHDTETVVDARGRVRVFQDANVVGAVTKRGVCRASHAPPVWSRVRTVHYVEGKTLSRVSVVSGLHSRRMTCIVHKASPAQLKHHCDACPKSHRSTNPSCSANLGLETFASLPSCLYEITTRRNTGQWKRSASFLRASKTANAEYTR